ncbi:MAG: hypothetical protein ABI415_04560 [Flavitalea sp.]
MNRAIDNLQKGIFAVLLYVTGFGVILSDLALGDQNRTPVYAAFDLLIISLALTSFSFIRSGLAYILLFAILCIAVNLSYSEATLFASLNGLREIFTVFAIIIFYNKVFSEGNEELAESCIEIFKTFGFIFILCQPPVAFAQYFIHGPTDFVGGTYGNYGSGSLTFSIIFIVYFLHHFKRSLFKTILLYACLIPLFLNETKISFILIPMMVLFIRFQPKLKNLIVAIIAAGIFLLIANKYYSNAGSTGNEDNISTIFSADYLNDYLMADIYTYPDIPRFTKIILSWRIISEQTNTFLFGLEYGLFKGSNVVGVSRLAERYQWLLSGTRPYLYFLLMQGGTMLLASFLLLIGYVNKKFRQPNKFKLFLLIMFFLILVYNDLLRNQSSIAIYFFIVFYANSTFYSEKELT